MIGLQLTIVLLLILINGLLSMSELAIVSARTPRLQQRADRGDAGALVAIHLAEDPNKFLSSVQIGITLIGIVNGAFGGAALAGPFAEILAKIPGMASYANKVSGVVVVLVITYLSLIIGELVPKQLALQRSETIAARMAQPMRILATISAPIVWLLSVSSAVVLKLLRADQTDEPGVTEEEVKILLRQATEAGVFERAEQELVSGVFGLGDRTAGELMTPRHAIAWLDLADPEEVNRQRMAETPHELYPVYEGSTDNVLGVVSSRNLWHCQMTGSSTLIRDVMEPALFVPEISPVLTVMQQMRDNDMPMAIVVDEYGGIEGLLTVTDLLDDLVEDLGDDGESRIEGAVQRKDGTWLVDGALPAHEFRELFDIDRLEGEEHGHFETIGGFIMDQLGHIPAVGEEVAADSHRIEVVDMDGHRIDKVLVVPPPESDDPGTDLPSEDL